MMSTLYGKLSLFCFALAGCLAVLLTSGGSVLAETKFKSIPTQYIAALADSGAKSGTGAEKWGIWTADPGPRGVRLSSYFNLVANGGVAPTNWQFNEGDWWLEENGLIMEPPKFPMPAGKYLVTGNRETKSVLTVYPKDANGAQRWELADGASIYDVTHLRCRAARYVPSADNASCKPTGAKQSDFPMAPNISMPEVENCKKQDYAVLFIIGVVDG